ncbi:hypothetical protein R70211_05973 [Paraburkholderia domus]|uniref:Uncharacterized protein n=1 Tax=Paraburkholderia domus TaxID=2793075 RepID=A0A9N8N331_9BURK|nr:hypothetical protein R70211_05973 [Paraburkholderia domus]
MSPVQICKAKSLDDANPITLGRLQKPVSLFLSKTQKYLLTLT